MLQVEGRSWLHGSVKERAEKEKEEEKKEKEVEDKK